MKKTLFLISLVFSILASTAFAQTYEEYLSYGLDAYSRSDWSSAIFSFQKADAIAASSKPEPLYWLVMANASARNYNAALGYANTFLQRFPHNSKRADIIYQQGRMYCLCAEHEKSIQALYGFLRQYSGHRQVPSAYYWIGENLYMAGRLQDARVIFSRIVLDYPTSAKASPAKYKIALIDQASTQEELLSLLKISHEELLKLSEEYEKNKKSYEQTVSAYQKQVGETNRDTRIAELAEKLQMERKKNAEIYDKMVMLEMKNQELLATLARLDPSYASKLADGASVDQSQENTDMTDKEKRRLSLEELRAKAKLLQSMYDQLLEENNESNKSDEPKEKQNQAEK